MYEMYRVIFKKLDEHKFARSLARIIFGIMYAAKM